MEGIRRWKFGIDNLMAYGLSFMAMISQAQAEIITPTAKTDEIVVTATRSEKELLEIPANVTVISEDDIKKSNARYISEILRSESGLLVNDWTGIGKTVTIDIRGFGETGPLNTLVLVDGRRVTQVDLAGTDWSQIPIEDVSKIEIVRGAGSILYGDNAAAGTINIITKKGAQGVNSKLNTFSGSYNTHNSTFYANGGNQDLTFSINQTYRNTDGYRKNSYFNSNDTNISLGLLLCNEFNTEMNMGIHNDEYGLPGYLTPAQIVSSGRRSTTTPDNKATTEDYYYKLKVNNSLDSIGDFTTDLSLRNKTSSSIYSGWGTFDNKIDSMHLSPRYIKKFSVTGMPGKITAGVDWLRDQANLSGTNADKESQGIYVLGEMDLDADNYPADGWLASAGYRWEKTTYLFSGGGVSARKTHNENIFNLGMSGFSEQLSMFANYSQNFRFPAVDEYFAAPPFGGGLLKPQSGDQIEAGIRGNVGFIINISFFRINTDDEIFYNPVTFANENYEKVQRNGMETGIKFDTNLWHHGSGDNPTAMTFNYTRTDAEFQAGAFKGNEVPGVPHSKYSIIITSPSVVIDNLDANIYYNHVGRRYLISDQTNQQPLLDAYNTVDVKFIYQYKKLKVSLGVNNVFNQRYEEYGSTNSVGTIALYPSPERNYMLGLAVEF